MIRIERRLEQPRWLALAVPLGSIAAAFAVMTLVLLATEVRKTKGRLVLPGVTFTFTGTLVV